MAEIDFNKLQTSPSANDQDYLFIAPLAGVSDPSAPDSTADPTAATNPPRLVRIQNIIPSSDQLVPAGGGPQQVLTKSSPADGDTEWTDQIDTGDANVQSDWTADSGDAFIQNKPDIPSGGDLVPPGGNTGQLLSKASTTSGDTEWVDAPSGGGGGTSGLESVATNNSISGDGTEASPLGVVNPFTDDDEQKLDNIAEGAQVNVGQPFTSDEKAKLSGIAPNAEVNVNADWTADSGDANILNKPTIPSGGDLVPDGGTAGQVLSKVTGADGDTEWADAPSGGTGGGSSTFLGLTDTPAAVGADGTVLGIENGALAFVAPSGGGGGFETRLLGTASYNVLVIDDLVAAQGDEIVLDDSDHFIVIVNHSGSHPTTGEFWVLGDDWRGLTASEAGRSVSSGGVASSRTITLSTGNSSGTFGISNQFLIGRTANNEVLVTSSNANLDVGELRVYGVNEGSGSDSGGGASAFTDLTDTPDALGTAGQMPVVNPAGDGLIFADQADAGLSAVESDDTLDGDGTSVSPLAVAIPFTRDEKTKLSGVDVGAQANVGVEFSAEEKTKLGNIETAATADQDGAEIINRIDTALGQENWKAGEVFHNDTLEGLGTSANTLGVNVSELVKDLFGNFDEGLDFTTSNSWNVGFAVGNFNWRPVSLGTLTMVTPAQLSAGESFRGTARVVIAGESGGAPIKWRVRFYDGSSGNLLQSIPYTFDGNGGIPQDFNFNKGTETNITWTLEVRGVGTYSGTMDFANVILHSGDGEASAAVRAEITRDVAGIDTRLGEAFVDVDLSADSTSLIFERDSSENPKTILLPTGGGGGTGGVTSDQFDDLVEEVDQVEAKVDGILSRTTDFSGSITPTSRDGDTSSPDYLFDLPQAEDLPTDYSIINYPLRIFIEGAQVSVGGFSGTSPTHARFTLIENGPDVEGDPAVFSNTGLLELIRPLHKHGTTMGTLLTDLLVSATRDFGVRVQAGTVAADGTFTSTATSLSLGVIIAATYSNDTFADKFSVDALSNIVDTSLSGASVADGTLTNTRHSGSNPVGSVIYETLSQAGYDAITTPVAGRLYLIPE